ncbi:hypothetical protein BOSE127_190036 [Bosea sp. 127]|nr:hypothetical protein BOSE7B_150409 [Bosea sp. 7B]VXC41182.1 hypothetical protein BOSE127_190036 [Bosea sp. 127]
MTCPRSWHRSPRSCRILNLLVAWRGPRRLRREMTSSMTCVQAAGPRPIQLLYCYKYWPAHSNHSVISPA